MREHIIHSADECPPAGGYCRTHELNIQLLAALYAVSRVLSRSLEFNETLRDLLRVLHDEAGLTRGLISVVDPESGKLNIHTIYTPEGTILDDNQYGPGEGIIGMVLERPRTIKLARGADDPNFLNRNGVYQPELPFIAVPIKAGSDLKGVLEREKAQIGLFVTLTLVGMKNRKLGWGLVGVWGGLAAAQTALSPQRATGRAVR